MSAPLRGPLVSPATYHTVELCVGFTDAERCDAIQQLVLPHTVRALAREIACPSGIHAFACNMAAWWTRNWGTKLRYFSDPINCDRWSTPQQTFARRGGDCDDLAIVAASLALASGNDAHVAVGTMWVEEDKRWVGHAWVEGRDSAGWFLFEATSPTGHHEREGRPWNYRARQLLQPGRCTLVR